MQPNVEFEFNTLIPDYVCVYHKFSFDQIDPKKLIDNLSAIRGISSITLPAVNMFFYLPIREINQRWLKGYEFTLGKGSLFDWEDLKEPIRLALLDSVITVNQEK